MKIGYIPNYSHLIGIMISKTIGYNGVYTTFSDTPIFFTYPEDPCMEYLPTLTPKNVGKYSIHGSLGIFDMSRSRERPKLPQRFRQNLDWSLFEAKRWGGLTNVGTR